MALISTPLSAPALASRRLPLVGENETYAKSRKALLVEEIDLRRRLARVAELRRALPAGPILRDYIFQDTANRPVSLSKLFKDNRVLILYVCDFGSLGPSPLCYHFLAALQANMDALRTRAEFAVLSFAPAKDVEQFSQLHAWQSLAPHQIISPEFADDMHLVSKQGQCLGTLLVCRQTEDGVRLFWKSEMTPEMADSDISDRDVFDLASLWSILDLTPMGRLPDNGPDQDARRLPWEPKENPKGGSGRWPRPVYGMA